jgi:16S rRNA (adenine1518-N6/adenine1519-N6)-dimethyltransferase
MQKVTPKKHLGQHFLTDLHIARKIADSLPEQERILELGPGMGVLTQFLVERKEELHLIEIDKESVAYLQQHFLPNDRLHIHEGDFLHTRPEAMLPSPFALIGNFPYNISSQIFFKVLDHKDEIPCIVGMLQKEVARRLCAPHGNKEYGILSVLLQTWYDCEYLFTVKPGVFNPPPKVDSGVIRLTRNERKQLPVDEKFFKQLVKMGFNQRRKTLRNALKGLNLPTAIQEKAILNKRAEQLPVEDFLGLAWEIQSAEK